MSIIGKRRDTRQLDPKEDDDDALGVLVLQGLWTEVSWGKRRGGRQK